MKNKRSVGSIKYYGNNKYRLRVSAGFDDFGRRIQVSRNVEAKSITEAEKYLLRLYQECKQVSALQNNKEAPKTLGELFSEYKTFHMSALRPNTQYYYECLWEKHLKQFEKTKLETCSPVTVRKILASIDAGARTKQGVYGLLKVMLNYASIENNYIQENPCNKVPAPHYKAKEKSVLTRSEIAEIYSMLKTHSLEQQLSFLLAVVCGMRRGEIMALCWSDIDFEKRTLSITKSMARTPKNGKYIGEPKTKSSIRTLSIPQEIINVLIKLRAEQEARAIKLGDKWIHNDFVFKGWNGEVMDLGFATRWWNRFRQEHNIAKNVNFHALRHTAATHMIDANIPISAVSSALGHAQISTTTDIYTHKIEDSTRAAVDVVARFLCQAE